MKNLSRELTEAAQVVYYKKDKSAPTYSLQSVDEIMKIVKEARIPPPSSTPVAGVGCAEEEEADEEKQGNQEKGEEAEGDDEDEYDKTVKEAHASENTNLVNDDVGANCKV